VIGDRFLFLAMAGALGLATAALATPTSAEPLPRCGPETLGQVACATAVLCECRYSRATVMTGIREGFQWDCGVLRPRCGEGLAPESRRPFEGPYPAAVGIDRSHNTNQTIVVPAPLESE
jgi:hypothetical protein